MTLQKFRTKRNRMTLHGKKISQIEIIQKTASYYLGDKTRLEPMTNQHISYNISSNYIEIE